MTPSPITSMISQPALTMTFLISILLTNNSVDHDTAEDGATYHTSNPIEQLLFSLANELNNEIHGIDMLDLLLTDAIANLNADKNNTDTPNETPLGHIKHSNDT
jgi:hypothetical protein